MLALNAVESLRWMGSGIDFATSLSLEFDGVSAEADYVGWWVSDAPGRRSPELVIGEAKSFGEGELITRKDIAKLSQLAKKLPGATFVVSVMRDTFTENEKKILTSFVKRCRRPNELGLATNNVIVLTGNELFFDFSITETWKKLGGVYAPFSNYDHTRSLRALAEATQSIYLSLPSYLEDRRARWRNRLQRRDVLTAKHDSSGSAGERVSSA